MRYICYNQRPRYSSGFSTTILMGSNIYELFGSGAINMSKIFMKGLLTKSMHGYSRYSFLRKTL